MPARALAVLAALLLVMLSLGVTGSAFADPGNGQALGKDNGNDGGGSQAASSVAVVDNGTAGNGSSNGNAADGQANGQANGNGNGSDDGQAVAATVSSGGSSAKGNGNAGAATNKGQSKKLSSSGSTTTGSSDHSKGNSGTSGTYDQHQPLSNADRNSGGANGKCPGGPYCSTRDGSPSMNGNGGGKAVGKPCAGCVGKADNKNPKGQYPNGSDHNKGYECDGNHGIGRTNPAHTGCKTAPPPPPGCVPTPTQDKNCHELPPCVLNPHAPGCIPKPPGYCETHPDLCPPPPGYCETHPNSPVCNPRPPTVEGEEAGPPTRQPVVLGIEAFRPHAGKPAVAPAAARAGALPSTGAGSDLGLAALAGVALLTVGAATLLLRRRTG